MYSMGLGQEEVLSRKDYLKKKKREKRKTKLSAISKKTWIMLAFILIISIYVIYQFYIYNTKHRLIQTLPDEISSMKEYNVYYVSETYAYDAKNQLKSMSTTSNEKTTIDEGLGITAINIINGNVYGIIDGKLVVINTKEKEKKIEVLVEKNVKGYAIHNEDIFVYLNGEGNETGLYQLGKKKKIKKIISSEINQILIDDNNIYIVNQDKNIIRYNKKGEEEKYLVSDGAAAGVIQDNKNIYFVNTKDSNKLYRIEKETTKISPVTIEATLKSAYVGMDAYSYMGVYDNAIYYINTKDGNKLYKTEIDAKEDVKVLEDNIQILDVIEGTIFYKVAGDIGVYRYDIANQISSQVTSARVVEFKAEK